MSIPQAEKIILSHRQQTLLKQIVRRTTNPYRLVRRAQLILLAAAGVSNTQLNRELQLERGQVRLWRERWLAATSQLATVEAENSSDRELMALIMRVLSDRSRPGTTNYFSTEQVEEDFKNHIAQTLDTDPEAGWIFIVDQLNIHQSESRRASGSRTLPD
jgi:hypothetical protein